MMTPCWTLSTRPGTSCWPPVRGLLRRRSRCVVCPRGCSPPRLPRCARCGSWPSCTATRPTSCRRTSAHRTPSPARSAASPTGLRTKRPRPRRPVAVAMRNTRVGVSTGGRLARAALGLNAGDAKEWNTDAGPRQKVLIDDDERLEGGAGSRCPAEKPDLHLVAVRTTRLHDRTVGRDRRAGARGRHPVRWVRSRDRT